MRGPSFEARPAERPNPQRFLQKREGSPAGLDIAKRRLSAGSPGGSPKIGAGSPAGGAMLSHPGSPTKRHASKLFWRLYDRGDLPAQVDQGRPGKNGIRWKSNIELIDLHYYLPVFLDGCVEAQDPYRLLAVKGTEELIAKGGERVLPVIPQLIMPLKAALMSPNREAVAVGLAVLEQLARCAPRAGEALLPYFRQLLPPLNRHIGQSRNLGDGMDYGQRSHRGGLGEAVRRVLGVLEQRGGKDAFVNIKYVLPTYESALRPVKRQAA